MRSLDVVLLHANLYVAFSALDFPELNISHSIFFRRSDTVVMQITVCSTVLVSQNISERFPFLPVF